MMAKDRKDTTFNSPGVPRKVIHKDWADKVRLSYAKTGTVTQADLSMVLGSQRDGIKLSARSDSGKGAFFSLNKKS